MAEHDPSKTEQATGRRKSEAKKKGQIPLSREVPTATVLLGGVLIIYALSATGTARLTSIMRQWFSRATEIGVRPMTTDTLQTLLILGGQEVLMLVLPVALGITLVGVASYGVQTGLMVFPDRFTWDFNKLNPINGFSRLFSLRSVVELIKSILKVAFIAGVGVLAVKNDVPSLPELITADVSAVLGTTAWLAFKMAVWVCGVIAVLAAADYAYQRFEWERSLRMTKEEVKQEHKETEGDPILRSRIRGVQRSMARKR
ncbi:MAG: EscU/YscU/HrcU family type III secretion system export apparatus switch protein, partial [Nitrospirae bacterium]|nr:EscU/YscU/HrcU family type III secretion system export apparatus switch protein [Nitrospirota bacterium]